MLVQLTIDTRKSGELNALAALVTALSGTPSNPVVLYPTKLVNQTDNGTFDVPPVPIEQAIDEAHADVAAKPAAPTPAETPAAKPLSVTDALAAIQAAQARGIGIDKVRAILSEQFEGKRVTELSEEKRAAFVAALAGA